MLSEAVVFMIVSQPTHASTPWWDTGWQYRRPITVGSRPENYQIQVVIPDNIPKSDYPSIRFVWQVGQENYLLPYWIEHNEGQYNTSGQDIAWVRVLDNSNDSYSSYLGGNTIYMYYHNPSAVSAENGDNVFLFFDDFGGGSGGQSALDNSKWGPTSTGVDVYQTYLQLNDYQNNACWVAHDPGHGMNTAEENTPRIVEFRINDNSVWRGGVLIKGPGWDNKEMWGIYPLNGDAGAPSRLFGTGSWGSVNLENGKWYIGNITFYGATKSNIGRAIYYGNDNANYRQQADNIPDWTEGTWNPGGVNWYFDTYQPEVFDGGNNSTYYYDWFFVRKYADPEPSAPVGNVETLPSWTGTATIHLENLYKVGLAMDLQINTGSKLVVKFYDYSSAFESGVVIENFAPPQSVVDIENVAHPSQGSLPVRTAVKNAELVLTTDDENEVISTIASFTVHKSDLRTRYLGILRIWASQPTKQPAFRAELIDILKMYAGAPS
jgi:hypothetical protein